MEPEKEVNGSRQIDCDPSQEISADFPLSGELRGSGKVVHLEFCELGV